MGNVFIERMLDQTLWINEGQILRENFFLK